MPVLSPASVGSVLKVALVAGVALVLGSRRNGDIRES
jgi:hypothetical protein